ncbi:hypothetical protein ACFXDJ_16175 [Streptomyces sp. NPDC059443]
MAPLAAVGMLPVLVYAVRPGAALLPAEVRRTDGGKSGVAAEA